MSYAKALLSSLPTATSYQVAIDHNQPVTIQVPFATPEVSFLSNEAFHELSFAARKRNLMVNIGQGTHIFPVVSLDAPESICWVRTTGRTRTFHTGTLQPPLHNWLTYLADELLKRDRLREYGRLMNEIRQRLRVLRAPARQGSAFLQAQDLQERLFLDFLHGTQQHYGLPTHYLHGIGRFKRCELLLHLQAFSHAAENTVDAMIHLISSVAGVSSRFSQEQIFG